MNPSIVRPPAMFPGPGSRRGWTCWVLLGLVWLGISLQATAQTDVEEALRSADLPWYDEQTDGYRSLVSSDTPSSQDPDKPSSSQDSRLWDDLGELLRNGVLLLIFALTVAVLIALAIHFIRRYAGDVEDKVEAGDAVSEDVDRVESLREDWVPEDADLWDRAERLRRAGQLDEAIVALFAYLGSELVRRGELIYRPGMTPRQIVRAVHDPTRRAGIEPTHRLFELVLYGGQPVDPDAFDQARQAALGLRQDFLQHDPRGDR